MFCHTGVSAMSAMKSDKCRRSSLNCEAVRSKSAKYAIASIPQSPAACVRITPKPALAHVTRNDSVSPSLSSESTVRSTVGFVFSTSDVNVPMTKWLHICPTKPEQLADASPATVTSERWFERSRTLPTLVMLRPPPPPPPFTLLLCNATFKPSLQLQPYKPQVYVIDNRLEAWPDQERTRLVHLPIGCRPTETH
jgi:hypothetical protein